MYEVPATSASLMLFVDPEVYEGTVARKFFENVDLSSGEGFANHFKPLWKLGSTVFTVRKMRVKKLCDTALGDGSTTQVISIGAGLDPLILDLAERFPEVRFFDVDIDYMDVKAEINASIGGPEVSFVTADLSAPDAMVSKLKSAGWNAEAPTLVVAEGIAYYLTKPMFASALEALRTGGGSLVLEYSLPTAEISRLKYKVIVALFYARTKKLLSLEFPMVRYGAAYLRELAQRLRGNIEENLTEHDSERALRGRNEFFGSPDSGWIRVALIRYA